jgi:hypothetical protein
MKKAFAIVSVMIFALAGFFFVPSVTLACSCLGGDALERMERSAVVFQGEVIDDGGKKTHRELRPYTFKVEKVWKGDPESRLVIHAYNGSSASCGIQFERGEHYLIFAYEDGTTLQTNLCSGNVKLSEAAEDLQLLGPGIEVADESDNGGNGKPEDSASGNTGKSETNDKSGNSGNIGNHENSASEQDGASPSDARHWLILGNLLILLVIGTIVSSRARTKK